MSEARNSADIAKYISSPDSDIYTVSGLPEEVIAVIFAYVSRSPESFKTNIAKALEEEGRGKERAEKFHEKWVLNYGHASVAEHASVHVGIEKVSRLFSSLLEMCGEHLSFTEYSQRYQKPRRGDFVIPPELDGSPDLKKQFLSVCDAQYDTYEKLNAALLDFLLKNNPDGKSRGALEKVAFEDARYALCLASMTNLAMTANARAVEDCLSKLLSSPYREAGIRAGEIKREVRFSVPTLVKYAAENPHITGREKDVDAICKRLFNGGPPADAGGDFPAVGLLDWTGKGEPDAQQAALRLIAGAMLYERSDVPGREIESISETDIKDVFAAAVRTLGKHDNPHRSFNLVSYRAEFTISEACWHQLLRHRKAEWFAKEPCVSFGFTTPPNIKAAGAEGLLAESVRLGGQLFRKLWSAGFETAARYAVTNAHNRKVEGCFTLWELYHLINLRMSEGAQWDIKRAVSLLADEVVRVHPLLAKPALERARSGEHN